MKKYLFLSLFVLAACNSYPVGNSNVPEPAKAVDLKKYEGLWYEMARYENSFEEGCEHVTAEYTRIEGEKVKVVNTCRDIYGNVTELAEGRAKVVENSNNAKLKVSFFWPFYGDYWVLDRADNYSWSIVGEPSGKYLWILTREAKIDEATKANLINRTAQLGYDTKLIRLTKQ